MSISTCVYSLSLSISIYVYMCVCIYIYGFFVVVYIHTQNCTKLDAVYIYIYYNFQSTKLSRASERRISSLQASGSRQHFVCTQGWTHLPDPTIGALII